MATKLSSEELLKTFESMTVLELSEFLKAFEEKFEVTAAAPVAAVAVAGGGDAAAAEEQDEFDVVLTAAGDRPRCRPNCSAALCWQGISRGCPESPVSARSRPNAWCWNYGTRSPPWLNRCSAFPSRRHPDRPR